MNATDNQFETRDKLLDALVLAVTGKASATVTDQIEALRAAADMPRQLKDVADSATFRATVECAKVGVVVGPVASDRGSATIVTPSSRAEAVAEFSRLCASGDNQAAGKFYAKHRDLILGRTVTNNV